MTRYNIYIYIAASVSQCGCTRSHKIWFLATANRPFARSLVLSWHVRINPPLISNKPIVVLKCFTMLFLIHKLLSTYRKLEAAGFLIGRCYASAPFWFSTPTRYLPCPVAPGNVCQLGVSWQTRWRSQSNKQLVVNPPPRRAKFWQLCPPTWLIYPLPFIL